MTHGPTQSESVELGRAARKEVRRASHGEWSPAPGRPDPVALLEDQNTTRLEWLVPIRHLRMSASPFTFFRGSARIMAQDLAGTPASGLTVQLGGDAHLSNFGAYASPGRRLVFDANDFDETLRGPWEWDLKRLATSFMIAAQHLGIGANKARGLTSAVTAAYRQAMTAHAAQGALEVWYQHVDIDDVRAAADTDGTMGPTLVDRLDRFEGRAKMRTNLQALKKLTTEQDGRRVFRADPPVLLPLRSLSEEQQPDVLEQVALTALENYKWTLSEDRRWLFEQYEPVDFALKVVGVGSVGTRCVVALLEGRRARDPLFLQAKEATASVLEEHLGASPYPNHGQRVVEGQRMVQAESDIVLGWTSGRESRDFYVRQLRDWKGSADIESSNARVLRFYAAICGQTLARGHARSGDPAAIAAYAGTGDALDRGITTFAERYAKQNLEDFAAFSDAIASGRLPIAPSEAAGARGRGVRRARR